MDSSVLPLITRVTSAYQLLYVRRRAITGIELSGYEYGCRSQSILHVIAPVLSGNMTPTYSCQQQHWSSTHAENQFSMIGINCVYGANLC